MKAVDLSQALKPYSSGWVAVDIKNKVVVHARTFSSICEKVKNKPDLTIVPAASNYFGFVTSVHG